MFFMPAMLLTNITSRSYSLLCAAVNSIQLLHFMLVVTGAALLGMAFDAI